MEADIKNNIFHAALNYATIFSGPAKINSGIVLIAFGVDFFSFHLFSIVSDFVILKPMEDFF